MSICRSLCGVALLVGASASAEPSLITLQPGSSVTVEALSPTVVTCGGDPSGKPLCKVVSGRCGEVQDYNVMVGELYAECASTVIEGYRRIVGLRNQGICR